MTVAKLASGAWVPSGLWISVTRVVARIEVLDQDHALCRIAVAIAVIADIAELEAFEPDACATEQVAAVVGPNVAEAGSFALRLVALIRLFRRLFFVLRRAVDEDDLLALT